MCVIASYYLFWTKFVFIKQAGLVLPDFWRRRLSQFRGPWNSMKQDPWAALHSTTFPLNLLYSNSSRGNNTIIPTMQNHIRVTTRSFLLKSALNMTNSLKKKKIQNSKWLPRYKDTLRYPRWGVTVEGWGVREGRLQTCLQPVYASPPLPLLHTSKKQFNVKYKHSVKPKHSSPIYVHLSIKAKPTLGAIPKQP